MNKQTFLFLLGFIVGMGLTGILLFIIWFYSGMGLY